MRFLVAVFILIPSWLCGQTFTILPGGTTHTPADSVAVWFKVLEDDGIPVSLLSREQVRVMENMNPVTEFQFERTSIPHGDRAYIVLVLDASGSMRYQDKLANLQRSAMRSVDAMTDQDHCSIIAFSSVPRLLTGFTNDKSVLRRAIEGIRVDGYTAIYDAIWEASVQLSSQPDANPKVILLVTDGAEEGASLFGLNDIVPKLQSVPNLTLHVFDLNKTESVNDLRRIARLGNGSYAYDPKPDKVFAAFAGFLTENRKSFLLRYKPPASNDAVRTVAVSVRLNGIEQTFESNYRPALGHPSGVATGLAVAGLVAACAAGIAGTVVYTKRRKKKHVTSAVSHRDPLLVEAPKMVFDMVGAHNGEEKTHALEFEQEPDGEKTVIIEARKKDAPVFGHLSVTDTNEQILVLDIDVPEILFGRSNQCKVRFENMEVSRLHAKLRLEAEGFVLYDLGSANGTFVNGEEVQKRLLKEGDEIEVGKNRVILHGTNGQL